MLLSVVIPHYSLPKDMLERCIESIMAQGMPDGSYEVIVVDDGSPEPPTWLAGKYGSKGVRLITAAHGGPGAARNRGIEEAQGKYIQFVDGDDYLLSNGQMQQCLAMLESEKPQILRFFYMVSSDGKPVKSKPHKVKFSNTISGAVHMRDTNLSGSPCTYFFRKGLAMEENIRFTPDIFHEDDEFNTMLHYHAQTLIESDAVLYCYCIREGSTTANRSAQFEEKRIDNIFTIIERLHDFKAKHSPKANRIQTNGIDRKLRMLCVDAILNMMYDNRSAKEIYDTCLTRLAPLSLFPLPQAGKPWKYTIFRKLANSPCGMRILRTIIPRKKPAKR